jgi:hypothetical protein
MTYTIEDITEAWDDYKSKKVIKFLQDGKEKYLPLEGKRIETKGLVNARIVDLQSVISFPEFMRTKWEKRNP